MNALVRFNDVNDPVFASFVRVLRGAPTRNKLKCFGLIARDSWRGAAVYRQDVVDDLQRLAESGGLVEQFGVDAVQSTLASAFSDGGIR
jgi:hypothetical protein